MPVCTTPAWFPSFGSLLVSKHFQCLSEDPKLSWFEQDFGRCSPFVRICEPARQSGFLREMSLMKQWRSAQQDDKMI